MKIIFCYTIYICRISKKNINTEVNGFKGILVNRDSMSKLAITTFRTTFNRSKLHAMLSETLKAILHKRNPVESCLNTLGATLHRTKLYAMLSETLQTTLCKKKSCAILF